jgi:hypothetical protein
MRVLQTSLHQALFGQDQGSMPELPAPTVEGQQEMMSTIATLLRELNLYRVILNKQPIKRWRSTRDKLYAEIERLADQVDGIEQKKKAK